MEAGPGKKPDTPGHSDARAHCFAWGNERSCNGNDILSLGETNYVVTK